MFKKGNLGKKIRLMLLTAMLGMAGVFSIVDRCADIQEALKLVRTEVK